LTRVVNLLHVKEPQASEQNYRPCDELITDSSSPADCRKIDQETEKRRGPVRAVEPFKKKKEQMRGILGEGIEIRECETHLSGSR
jgi:hypothetical protein